MDFKALHSISAIDGRYWNKTEELSQYFSEFALIKYRVYIEVEYFIALCELPLPQLQEVPKQALIQLRKLCEEFNETSAWAIKEIEKTTNHDVKAVEYFLRDKFDEIGLGHYKEFIHFGLTSQDINNTAVPLMYKNALEENIIPFIETLISELTQLSETCADVPLLAHTHGQPASPTKLGKEFMVFVERMQNQVEQLKKVPFGAKFGGATGNFNAHCVAYPELDWPQFANHFVNAVLKLKRQTYTTQIEHYDNLAASFDALKRINIILLDLCRDVWMYIAMNYFKQKLKEGEVGSSAMPHKVNPIDFENAEGNLGMANALFEFLSSKLPVSRLQRDLTDSTVIRNIGMPIAHSLIAYKAIQNGMRKLLINRQAIEKDLEENWAVVAEAIQTILRREFYPHPYNALKQLTRTHQTISRQTLHDFIDHLDLSEKVKSELKVITPHNYTGIF